MKSLSSTLFTSELENKHIDYFICSASFEDRCFTIPRIASELNLEKALVFGSTDFDKTVLENRHKLISLFKKAATVTGVDFSMNDPVSSYINITTKCEQLFVGQSKTLLIDITTFTHEGLLMLVRLLLAQRRPEDSILISYVSAEDYSFNVKNPSEKWLTKGVKELRSVIGYPGFTDPSKKNLLIILFGFEKERTVRLIDAFDSELVSLAFGAKDDSISINHQQINETRHRELLELYSNAEKFELSLTDPHSAKKAILEYVEKHREYNIIIAPMNNKISTIGAALAAIENVDIQLFYMQANIYNVDAYSKGNASFFLSAI